VGVISAGSIPAWAKKMESLVATIVAKDFFSFTRLLSRHIDRKSQSALDAARHEKNFLFQTRFSLQVVAESQMRQ